MGEHTISHSGDEEQLRIFMQRLLLDLRALEKMLDDGMFETGVTRLGAEQELFLVDRDSYAPAPVAIELLERIGDPHFTTELGRYNLEVNLDPLELTDDCFSRLHKQVDDALTKARAAADGLGVELVLTGILPTLGKPDLRRENMTPMARYAVLDEAVRRLRKGHFELHIRGRDELKLTHDSVMLESCNTSFQVHLQVDPGDFARLYNLAQVVAGPVLAAAVNSPLLFGKRLWRETRIALFQQSIDTRMTSPWRQQQPRVSFGRQWVEESVLEIFREDIARFPLLMSAELSGDPFEELAAGGVPDLKALRLHNGTVYRWNRPCYGISNGKPHLRIENRVLPAGPSVVDEVANAVFWFGLMKGLAMEFRDIRRVMDFDAAKENFIAAARLGLNAQFHWLGGRPLPAGELIRIELLPRARSGLNALGIRPEDRDRYLSVLEERVDHHRTGAEWLIESLGGMHEKGSLPERLSEVTAVMVARQKQGQPVYEWPVASHRESESWHKAYTRVSSLMTTDLFTVGEHDVIDKVANLMDWKHIRHVPVEDREHRLVGLVTHRNLLRALVAANSDRPRPIPVREVMQREVVTVAPDTPSLEAIALMRRHRIACVPVVEDERLVGIISERDFMRLARHQLELLLGEASLGGKEPKTSPARNLSKTTGG